MPALMIGQVSITGLAQNRLRAVPFELWVLLAVWMTAGVMTAGHELGGAVFDAVNVAESWITNKMGG